MPIFRKVFNSRIISLIVSICFLFTTTLYSYPASKDSLRVPSIFRDESGVERFKKTYHVQKGQAVIVDAELAGLVSIKESRWPKYAYGLLMFIMPLIMAACSPTNIYTVENNASWPPQRQAVMAAPARQNFN